MPIIAHGARVLDLNELIHDAQLLAADAVDAAEVVRSLVAAQETAGRIDMPAVAAATILSAAKAEEARSAIATVMLARLQGVQ